MYRRQYRITSAGNSGSRASSNDESETDGHLLEQFDNTPWRLRTFHSHPGANRNPGASPSSQRNIVIPA